MLLTQCQYRAGANITIEVAVEIGEGQASINHGKSSDNQGMRLF